MNPSGDISTYGWEALPTADGGARIRRSKGWRMGTTGCACATITMIVPFAAAAWFIAWRFFKPHGDHWFSTLLLVVPLGVMGITGLMVVASVLQLLTRLLLREEWLASRNRLVVRRMLWGLGPTKEYLKGTLLLEPHYSGERRDAHWRVLVLTGEQRHALLREPAMTASIANTSPTGVISQAEAVAIAGVISQHTGWPVTTTQTTAEPHAVSVAERSQLLDLLHRRDFRKNLDERQRQVIEPPRRGRLSGLFMLGCGGVAFYTAAVAVSSFVGFAQENEQPVWDPGFWVFVVPMVLVGSGLVLLGLSVMLGRERWTLDDNLLIVSTGFIGQREQQFADCRLRLDRVRVGQAQRKGVSGGGAWEWQLHLQDASGQVLRVLDRHAADDSPRLLGTLLAESTGWPLSDGVL